LRGSIHHFCKIDQGYCN